MRKFLLPVLAVFTLVLILFFIGFYTQAQEPLPPGQEGPPARELADRVFQGADWEKWDELDAIEFTFSNMGSRHFRDRKRGLVEIQYAQGADDYTVQYEIGQDRFRVWRNGSEIQGEEARQAYEIARSYHRHDYFWLYPVETIKTSPVEFKKVGERALLVHFPMQDGNQGDSYLLIVNDDYRITHWKIWSEGLPFKGVEVSFERPQEIAPGVEVSTLHETFLQTIAFEDVRAYPDYPLTASSTSGSGSSPLSASDSDKKDGDAKKDRFQEFLKSTDTKNGS